MRKLRIDYDDDAMTIMENVNKELDSYGLEFVFDDEEHDGYAIYYLWKKGEVYK